MTTANDGPLTEAQRNELRGILTDLIDAQGLTVRDVARAVRCSPSVITQIRAGTYGGDEDRYLRAVRDWMAEQHQRATSPDGAYVETADARRVLAVCHRARTMPCMGKVVLESGAGKSAALAEAARRWGDRVVILQAAEAAASKLGLLYALADAVGVRTLAKSTFARLYREVRDRLAGYYAGGRRLPLLVLVDEATTLQPRALNLLRNLHDDEAVRLAVVLADTDRLDGELAGRGGLAGGYEQLRSRLGAVYAPRALRASSYGVRCSVSLDDVRAVAAATIAALGDEAALTADAARALWEMANTPGRLRNVVYRLRTVHDVARVAGVAPTYSAAELDYVAELVGAERKLRGRSPFGKRGEPALRAAKAAG